MSRRKTPRLQAKPSIDLLEEAVTLLRRVPAGAFVSYYLGAIPFWLGFLYFVADMAHSAFAAERLIGASLGLALLFIWMKCWHAAFCGQLRRHLLGEPEYAWSMRRVITLVVQQTSIQPWSLFLRPAAFVATLPFVWVAAFFQNTTVLADAGVGEAPRPLLQRAWEQTRLWPAQAHLVTVLLLVFGVFVWLNICTLVFVVPSLAKSLFGFETEASRNMLALFNSTVLTATLAATMMCMDPLFKAVYALRCFYGEALRSGQDLRVQLKDAQRRAITFGLVLLVGFSPAAPARAADAPPARQIEAAELGRSIDEVLQRREYAWRAPRREKVDAEESGWFRDSWKWLVARVKKVSNLFKKLIEWLFKSDDPSKPSSSGWSALPVQEIAYAVLGVGLVLIALGLLRRFRSSRGVVTDAQPLTSLPDLNADEVAADQLPADGWMDLMRKALAEGQRRVALRAAYLASLAHLGQRELLTIARYKSNREYERELQRRARSREALLVAFRESLVEFERAWYGDHEVSDSSLEQFTRNLEVIRAC